MGYYFQGDYYTRGGDAKFWTKFGTAAHKLLSNPIVGTGVSLIPGVGGIVGKALTGIASHTTIKPEAAAAVVTTGGGPPIAMLPSHTVTPMPGGSLPGAPSTALALTGGAGPLAHRGTVYMDGKRFHYSKRTGQLVKGRVHRMNVLNPRALRRAMSRAKGFARFASHVVSFTRHGAHGAKFKGRFGRKGHKR